MVWAEKYRPKKFEEVKGNEDVVEKLKQSVRVKKDIPHLLLIGRPGVGKTTLAYVIKNELNIDDQDWLELNASDERGIDTIRHKVKTFAKTSSLSKFKIILLDEADYLTPEAQHSLRRIMELYSKNCRFILTANYESKIIEPIKSRCSVLRLKPIDTNGVFEILKNIADSENVSYEVDALKSLAEKCNGDLRSAINTLEILSSNQPITKKKVEEDGDMNLFFKHLQISPKLAIRDLDELLKTYSERDILMKIFNYYLIKFKRGELKNAKRIFLAIAETDYRMAVGSSPYIQLVNLIYLLASLGGDESESGDLVW